MNNNLKLQSIQAAVKRIRDERDYGYGFDYTEEQVQRLESPDVTTEDIYAVISEVRVADDPQDVVDRIARALWEGPYRWDLSVVEYLLDCGNETLALLREAAPDIRAHAIAFIASQRPYLGEESLEELAEDEDIPGLTPEELLPLLSSSNSSMRQMGVRLSKFLVNIP